MTDLKGIVLLKDKVKDLDILAELVLKHKNEGKKIVFTLLSAGGRMLHKPELRILQ